MNLVKVMFYRLLASQFLFMAWLLSSIKMESKVTVQEPNGIILIYEPILSGAMSVTAVYLMVRQPYKIT